jgi:hypothetical protein
MCDSTLVPASWLSSSIILIARSLHYSKRTEWYTHKTSGFKTSGFKKAGFKTSETSALKNVRVYKMSGLQNVRSSKRPVAKKHPYIFCTCGWWKSAGSVAAMFAGKVMAVFYSLF